jgi:hypothetical protein
MPLRPISRMDDYRFPTEAWDVRGWTVRAEVGDEKVGKVEDMLLDSDGRLRYLEVDLGLMKKHVLVPLEFAHADRDDEAVWIDGMSKEQLERVPEYAVEPESLDEGYERRLTAFYGDRRGGAGRGRWTWRRTTSGSWSFVAWRRWKTSTRWPGWTRGAGTW